MTFPHKSAEEALEFVAEETPELATEELAADEALEFAALEFAAEEALEFAALEFAAEELAAEEELKFAAEELAALELPADEKLMTEEFPALASETELLLASGGLQSMKQLVIFSRAESQVPLPQQV